jgi:hypothetical protein
MPNQQDNAKLQSSNVKGKYDLEERIARFGVKGDKALAPNDCQGKPR